MCGSLIESGSLSGVVWNFYGFLCRFSFSFSLSASHFFNSTSLSCLPRINSYMREEKNRSCAASGSSMSRDYDWTLVKWISSSSSSSPIDERTTNKALSIKMLQSISQAVSSWEFRSSQSQVESEERRRRRRFWNIFIIGQVNHK